MSVVHGLAYQQARPGAHVAVVCSGCGCSYRVPPHIARKIERGTRSGRCEDCRERGVGSAPRELTERERAKFGRWWLDRYSDEELAALALGLGVEGASVERVRAARARLNTGRRRDLLAC